MIGEPKPALEDLVHYGVKGMHWGVRKEQGTPAGELDVTLKKGLRVYNVSGEKPRELSGYIFGAHEKRDVVNYRGDFAWMRGAQFGSVFSNAFEVKRDIKVAGRKTQIDVFEKLWNNDPKGVANAIAQTKQDTAVGAAIMRHVFKKDRTDVYEARIMAKGENWVKTKGFQDFNQALGSSEGRRIADMYQTELGKRGYSALVDLNDVKVYGSTEPIIYLNAPKNLKSKGSVPLSEADVNKAMDAYRSKEKLDAYTDDIHSRK